MTELKLSDVKLVGLIPYSFLKKKRIIILLLERNTTIYFPPMWSGLKPHWLARPKQPRKT